MLYLNNNGDPFLVEGTSAPEGGLALARINVPAGDTGPTFSGTITDLRLLGTPSSWFPPVATAISVALPTPMPNANYIVLLHLESASDPGRVHLSVVSKAKNAFALQNLGTADDVVVRWVALDLSVV